MWVCTGLTEKSCTDTLCVDIRTSDGQETRHCLSDCELIKIFYKITLLLIFVKPL